MTRKQIYILCALIIFIAGGFIFGVASRKGGKTADTNTLSLSENQNPVTSNPAANYYSSEVPKSAELTKPVSEAPAFIGATDEKFRIFEMQVSKNGYSPDNFTVNLGDTVQIKMTAVDGDYDFSMPWSGLYKFAKKGENKNITFGVRSAGTFNFECRDHCPAGNVIKGTVVVLP